MSAATAFCGLDLAHPIVNGSGTYDAIAARRAFGDALLERFPFSAFVSKTITLAAARRQPAAAAVRDAGGDDQLDRPAEQGPRRLPRARPARSSRGCPCPLITNVMGATADEIAALVEAVDARAEIDAIELNVSCPNVKTGLDIGADPAELAIGASTRVRPLTGKPLIVKLTPNASDVAAAAQAAEAAGADAVSLINTLRAYAPHPRSPGTPWLGGGTGGLSGPAVRAVALAQVAPSPGGVRSRSSAWAASRPAATPRNCSMRAPLWSPSAPRASVTRPRRTRIRHELHDLFAKSGDIVEPTRRCLGKKRCKYHQNRQPV